MSNVLRFIAILLFGIGIMALFKSIEGPSRQDQTQAWKDYYKRLDEENAIYKAGEAERNKKPEYASIMLDPEERWRAETFYKYRPEPFPKGLTPDAQKKFDEEWDKIDKMFASDRCSRHHEESSYFSRQQEQPDVSGLYYQRTIVGPNAGEWSIQFISGP
jgi:hypothetical protein